MARDPEGPVRGLCTGMKRQMDEESVEEYWLVRL